MHRKPRRTLVSSGPSLTSALVALAALSAMALAPACGSATTAESAEPRRVTERADLTPEERDTIDLFQEASPSVVFITTLEVRRPSPFSLDVTAVPRGSGSGFIWDERGHVVTNFHVVQGADVLQVTLADQTTHRARPVGGEPEKDLAVIRLEDPPERLRPLPVGRSSDLLVGQSVLAIGNPFGLDQTLTTGVISALGREIESVARIPIRDVIQTDAAINPGNSGGPLLDSAGRLIGVNTAIYSPSGASSGIGFAIPVDTVNWVVPQLIEFGRLQRPTIGITTFDAARIRGAGERGVLIRDVFDGSGAARAGLRPTRRDRTGRIVLGDVIVSVNGTEINDTDDLLLTLERFGEGDTVEVGVLRGDERIEVDVTLGPPARR
jgi:S1-C subfamily serine protease